MPDLAVIVPTRGRPGNIEKVIGAWDFTNAWDHADLVLVADADDPEIGGYRALIDPEACPVRLLEIPTWMPMVHKLDLAARELAGRYWALGFAGDDHLPQTIGWAKRYLTVLRELGTGMVYGDDGYQGAKLCTEWAMTSDVVLALGRMVPAQVQHMFCDNAVLELFTAAGAARHLPEIRIEHMHPYAGKVDTDDQYQRVNGREQMSRDRRTFQIWQRSELAAQIDAVQALRKGRPDERPSRLPKTAKRQGRITMRPPRFFKRVQAATPEEVMMALADFAVRVPGDQEIVEIGVFHGRTALQLAWGARQGNGAHVTAIDLWDTPGNTYGPPFTESSSRRWAHHHVKSLGYSRDITLIQGFSHDVAENWDGHLVGLLFVDGDHSKEGARRDIETWAVHLAPDARIAVDDYGHPDWPGVKEAVDELVDDGVLEPIELFHGALAVTRLASSDQYAPDGVVHPPVKAITSEGVAPPPESDYSGDILTRNAAIRGQIAEPDEVDRLFDGHEDDRTAVQPGELRGVAAGTSLDELNDSQLRELAHARDIPLGRGRRTTDWLRETLRTGQASV